jgi:hypothetical protein
MENTIANIRILDVVRIVHGYFIFVNEIDACFFYSLYRVYAVPIQDH